MEINGPTAATRSRLKNISWINSNLILHKIFDFIPPSQCSKDIYLLSHSCTLLGEI